MRWFDASKKVLIPFSNITHISKKVSEQISPKYLSSFLKTSLIQEDITLNGNSKVFCTYNSLANMYEIYLFETPHKDPILEFQLFEDYPDFKEMNGKYFLFITSTFFVVYLDNKPIFAFNNKNYTQEDIIKFIEFTHKITIYKTIFIDTHQLQALQNKLQHCQKLPFQRVHSSYEFSYYLAYLLLLGIVSFYFYYEKISYNLNNQTFTKVEIEKPYKNKEITQKITSLINNIALHNIKLEHLTYDKKLSCILIATHPNLYNFLALYKKNHKIIKLEKQSDTLFTAEIEIVF